MHAHFPISMLQRLGAHMRYTGKCRRIIQAIQGNIAERESQMDIDAVSVLRRTLRDFRLYTSARQRRRTMESLAACHDISWFTDIPWGQGV